MRTSIVPQFRTNLRAAALTGVALAAIVAGSHQGLAQEASETDPSILAAVAKGDQQGRMLVESDTLVYDLNSESVSAVGNVVIYYGAYTLTAERVDVDRRTKRVRATGGVELIDPSGNVVRSAALDLTDDLREGVAEALEIVTQQRTAFNAERARRTEGDVTEFENGTYLPCVDCDGVPGRKPVWQIKAKKIIHRQGDKTISFKDTTFEFLGVPIAWAPSFTTFDPSVKRKSGFLFAKPSYNSERGFGLQAPYFYALKPNMDVTLAPGAFSKQGGFFDAEFRHRVINGAYKIRVSGLRQSAPDEFAGTSGDRRYRGGVTTSGQFDINSRWSWGWDLAVATDRSYFDDYDLPGADSDSATNDIYLTGVDGRNRFEAHAYGFFITQEDDTAADALEQDVGLQSKQPLVHPVIDHQVYLEEPVAGGEVSIKSNFTSLTRNANDIFEFDADNDGVFGEAGETRLLAPSGSYSRASIDALWRRRFVDSLGQVFTPFAYFRGDVFFSSPDDTSGLDDDVSGRAMPAVGLEYSYPFLIQSSIGSQVIEPVAQLIVRPNETEIDNLPNEDSQSLVFDSTSLFDYDKFSGYDRVEGGTRLNVGFRYNGQFVNGTSVTASFGQSFQLAGRNSFDAASVYSTGQDSGLDGDVSDFVAGLSVDTDLGLLLNANARLDKSNLMPNRLEAQVVGLAGPVTAAFTYAFIRSQPDLGIEDDRQELQAAGSVRLNDRWRMFGSTRFDIENTNVVRNAIGVAYDDEAFSLSLSYAEDKTRVTGEATDRTVYLRLGFRTLGDLNSSFDVMK
ncbi:LPS-assembly protein LptD [Chthonobacter albigriseus]|uniref:LPS-assembly protein LptD n=1 Tax=Chthonobacter albigriseus TaxID=1683161 RepID=UPI0015EE8B39|nr:LPS-assembly protein LptD [Chthonobacter albigriseus]